MKDGNARDDKVTAPEKDYPPGAYAWYVVLVLMVVYVFSFVDRQLLALLVGPIKADLDLTDTQMSYLLGFSFALFYTVLGVPLGRLTDTRSRRTIIAVGLGLWSLMTLGCGLAQRYWQLFLARMGVGVGEATLSPAAYSLIADYFPPRRLALAISVYGMGIYLGAGMAYALGGVIVSRLIEQGGLTLPVVGTLRAWQAAFILVGAPGLLFAGLLYTIREPLRRGSAGSNVPTASVKEVARYFRVNWKAIACHNVGFSLLAFVGWVNFSWIPAFFQRTYGWTTAETGLRYGGVIFVFGSLGILSGGVLADWMAARGYRDARIRAGVAAALLNCPFALLYPLMPDGMAALALVAPTTFAVAMAFGTAPAAIQEMMPNTMRGQASAIYLFAINLIGLGGAPTAVAWCTDYLFRNETHLRYSLALVGFPACLLAAVVLIAGLRPFRKTLEALGN